MTIQTVASFADGPFVVFFQKEDVLFQAFDSFGKKDRDSLREAIQGFSDGRFASLEPLPISGGDLVLLVDCGEGKGLDPLDRLRVAAYKAARWLGKRQYANAGILLEKASAEQFQAVLSGLFFAEYRFDLYKSTKKKVTPVRFKLAVGDSYKDAKWTKLTQETRQLHDSLTDCRDLVNEPGSSLTPQDFVKRAGQLAKKYGLKSTIRNFDELKKEGFHGLVTVGKGSSHPPVMITLEYTPKSTANSQHLVMVGKGVTFDTGGISIKPAAGMWEMRMDMAGAATVLTALCSIAALKLPIRVSAVLCLAENRPGNGSVLPGDIFTARNGKTVMVDNTDAEGRLILTDGLFEAGALGATHIVDLATLTGAIIRALGNSMAGVFSNNEEFCRQIIATGATVGEKFWPMPLEAEYREGLEDKVADMKNVSGEAGAIVAALFLQEFIPEKTIWSHWDIAGTAFTTKEWKYIPFGATGWGMQSLVHLAKQLGA